MQISWTKHFGGKISFRNTCFSSELSNLMGILFFFCIKFITFPISISNCLTMQQSTVLTFVSFFQCLLSKHSLFSPGILTEIGWETLPLSLQVLNYFPINLPVILWGPKPGNFPRPIQVSLSKGLFLIMCCAIRYLNCLLA